jgi:hypothetical protein
MMPSRLLPRLPCCRQKREQGYAVNPLLLGFFIFVVVGSGESGVLASEKGVGWVGGYVILEAVSNHLVIVGGPSSLLSTESYRMLPFTRCGRSLTLSAALSLFPGQRSSRSSRPRRAGPSSKPRGAGAGARRGGGGSALASQPSTWVGGASIPSVSLLLRR